MHLVDRRIALVFGPVSDPKGVYGLAIIETEDETIAHDIRINDPAIKHNAGSMTQQSNIMLVLSQRSI
jgi:hypothetical protein